jgi:hypothetical protein
MPIELSSLRLHPGDEEDLRWFFVESAGAMGVRSNFGAIVRMIDGGRSPQSGMPREIEGRILASAGRARAVQATLERCGDEHAQVLRRCYGETSPAELAVFGKAGNLVPLSSLLEQGHRASRSKRPIAEWLQLLAARLGKGTAGLKDRALARELTRDAEAMLTQAQRAYQQQKNQAWRLRNAS